MRYCGLSDIAFQSKASHDCRAELLSLVTRVKAEIAIEDGQ